MTDFFIHGRALPFAGHLQKSVAKLRIIDAVGKAHDAIARPIVHLFLTNGDTHCSPLALCPCATESKKWVPQ